MLEHPMPEKKALLLRISPDLWENLNIWAKDELRSLNAQIEFILREAVHKRKGRDDQPSAKE
jgi:hypothetical protein